MEEKRKILELLFPKAVLKALTAEARAAVPGGMQVDGMVVIHRFPFRVGRESRTAIVNDKLHRLERPVMPGTKLNNDLYLLDAGELLQVSREHFLIEKTEDGYVIVDRGSKCGVAVNGQRIGANADHMSAPLRDGDVIAIGTSHTHFLYTFLADFDNSHW